jgi:hypothetical protein
MSAQRQLRLRTALVVVALVALALGVGLPLGRERSASWHLAEHNRLRYGPPSRESHERSHYHARRYLELQASVFSLP